MKKLLIVLIVLSVKMSLWAGPINFKDIVYASRIGTFMDQHMIKSAGIYTTVISFHDRNQVEYIDINAGYLKNLDSSKGSPLIEIGMRVDNLLARALSSKWGINHMTLAEFPALEFGPFIAVKTKHVDSAIRPDFLYGLGLAVGF